MFMSIFGSKGEKYAKMAFIAILVVVAIGATILIVRAVSRPSTHIYIALGDSVASGYGLIGYVGEPEGRYTSLFFEKLELLGDITEYHNFATSGYTTTDVLEFLHGLDSDEVRLFRNAGVITLNIGGNNILTPFLAYLADLQIVAGGSNIAAGASQTLSGAWGVIYELITGAGSIFSDGDTNISVGGIVGGLGDVLSGLGGMIFGVGEIVGGSPNVISTWRGSLSPELEEMFDEGVQTFRYEFREIILWLETNAPNATIIVNTVHNPIPQEILIVSVPIHSWAYVFISYINQIIVEESEHRGFLVADINYYLSERLDLTSFNLNPLTGTVSFDLVHPNADGHRIIAELNYSTFIKE